MKTINTNDFSCQTSILKKEDNLSYNTVIKEPLYDVDNGAGSKGLFKENNHLDKAEE